MTTTERWQQRLRENRLKDGWWDTAFGVGLVVSSMLAGIADLLDLGEVTPLRVACAVSISGAFSVIKGARALAKETNK